MKIAAFISFFILLSTHPHIQQPEEYRISGDIHLAEKSGTVYLSVIDEDHFHKPGAGLDSMAVGVTTERGYIKPGNFLEVGGHKVFRDDVWGRIRGIWQADHRYYRKHGLYDFPQKKAGLRILNGILLLTSKIPAFRKRFYGNVKKFPSMRYTKLIDKLIQEDKV